MDNNCVVKMLTNDAMMENVAVGTIIYVCNICNQHSQLENEMIDHMQNNHDTRGFSAFQSVSSYIVENSNESGCSASNGNHSQPERRLWNRETTLLLINLYEKHDVEFQNGIKKNIWQKIAKIIGEKTKVSITWSQCDTKWKGLLKTYKDIKTHNNTSGNNIKHWEYFDCINNIMNTRPEIVAVATCSSNAGLILNGQQNEPSSSSSGGANSSAHMDDIPLETTATTPSSSNGFNSTFMRKRKVTPNPIERRHKEKMQRQDRFLDIMDRIANAIERQGNKSTDDDAN